MRKIPLILLLLAVSIGAFAQTGLKVRSQAPQFEALSLDNKTFDLSQMKDKVVLLTFWSTRCAICHSEVPKMNRLTTAFQGKEVVFLAFTNENETKLMPYLAKNPFNFNIMPNSFGILMKYADTDKNGNVIMPYPSYFLIDREGSVALKTSGFDKTSVISNEITRLLAAGK